jgi:hypothetical protein
MPIETPKKKRAKDCCRNPHAIQTNAGSIIFQEDVSIDSTVGLKKDASYTEWNHAGGGFMKMLHSGTIISSSGDMSIKSDGQIYITSKGDKQEVITGNNRIYTHGSNIVLEGKQDKEQRDAAKKMAQIYDKIEKAKKDAIKSTKGDMVECRTCAQVYLVNKMSGFGSRLFATLENFTPPYLGFAIATLKKLYNMFIAPMLSEISGQSVLGGTCENPGCKDGKIESPDKKLQAGNKAAEETYKNNEKEIEKVANILKSGTKVYSLNGDLVVSVGLADMEQGETPYQQVGIHPLAPAHDSKGSTIFAQSGKGGGVPIIAYTNPNPPINGNATLNVVGKLLVKTGVCGFDFLTRGQGHIAAGDLKMVATEGEALLTSGNLTTIKGKIVRIDADDGSGTGGIILDGKHVRSGGSFHVDSNITSHGSVSIDGNLCAPFLITRSMSQQTTKSGSTKLVNNSAEWNVSAIATSVADQTLQTLQYVAMPGNTTDVSSIFKISMEQFDMIRKTSTLEPNTTGLCYGAFGVGIVQNYTHGHTSTPQEHTHDHTLPLGNYYDDRESWAGARTGASSVPIPANESGDGSAPGPKSSGGACGGGGYLYTSPDTRASKARRNRNRRFGIDGDDAFNGQDFVNVTPNDGTFYYDPDGSIKPDDLVELSIGFDCPSDLFVKKDDQSSTPDQNKNCD